MHDAESELQASNNTPIMNLNEFIERYEGVEVLDFKIGETAGPTVGAEGPIVGIFLGTLIIETIDHPEWSDVPIRKTDFTGFQVTKYTEVRNP